MLRTPTRRPMARCGTGAVDATEDHEAVAVLMLYRYWPPARHRWNGLGGKREGDEPPLPCIYREAWEEAGIDLGAAEDVRFAGTVTWPLGADPTGRSRGMYAFVAALPLGWSRWAGTRDSPQGLLSWQPIRWVCHPTNTEVADNIPHYLPPMLAGSPLADYYCDYRGDQLIDVIVRPLDPDDCWARIAPGR
jgi:8-oxo-dGTP diphosphatase